MRMALFMVRIVAGVAMTYTVYYLLLRTAMLSRISGVDPLPSLLFIGLSITVPAAPRMRLLSILVLPALLLATRVLCGVPVITAAFFIALWSTWLWLVIAERWRR